jgi:hypothetical protein
MLPGLRTVLTELWPRLRRPTPLSTSMTSVERIDILPDQLHPANPAVASQLHAERQWRGVAALFVRPKRTLDKFDTL